MQVSRETLEVAQDLEARDPEPAVVDRAHRGFFAAGMADDIPGVQHDLREAGVDDGAELGFERPGKRDRVHAEVVDVHRWLTTSSKVTLPR